MPIFVGDNPGLYPQNKRKMPLTAFGWSDQYEQWLFRKRRLTNVILKASAIEKQNSLSVSHS